MTRRRPLCPVTLRSVARELGASAANAARCSALHADEKRYSSASREEYLSVMLAMWAEHFEGQAKTASAEKRVRR